MENLKFYQNTSDTSSDNDEETSNSSVIGVTVVDNDSRALSRSVKVKRKKLELPGCISAMFDSAQELEPSESNEGGRVRTFKHERGNWASFVYIKLTDMEETLQELTEDVIDLLKPLDFKPMDDLHISLSRTFVMRHHWIDPMVASLKKYLLACSRCSTDMKRIKLFTNDEKTRTFVSVELGANEDMLKQYVNAVDKALTEFNLPTYYKEPSFHVSVAWSAGDVTGDLEPELLQKMNSLLDDLVEEHSNSCLIAVDELSMMAGNKTYPLPIGGTVR